MPIIRRKLEPSTVYPTNMRYNPDTDQVETLIGDDWVANPDADPRLQTSFPARITANPACDAAQSVTDALKNQIDGVLTAIDGSQTAFTIAGIILSLFTFGIFGVFISLALFLAHAMLDAGTASINASLTTTAYDTFTCILFCQFGSDGRLVPGGLSVVEADVSDQIGGLGATILNAMLNLAGEGGVNNLASLGTSTGDCDDCAVCEVCENVADFHLYSYGFTTFGTDLEYGDGWLKITPQIYAGDGAYYITLSTENAALCCTPVALEYLDGIDKATFYHIWNGCGESNAFADVHTSSPFENSLQSISLGWLVNPGRIKITFAP